MLDTIRVRRAEMCDIKPVFELSNDPVVRAHSIHKEPIPWESHVVWFEKAISNPDIRFFVAETEGGEFVGQVRFNREAVGWVVSVSVRAEFRGKGLARTLVSKAIDMVSEWPVIAHIKMDNWASRLTFEKCGFVMANGCSLGDGYICMKLTGGGNSL